MALPGHPGAATTSGALLGLVAALPTIPVSIWAGNRDGHPRSHPIRGCAVTPRGWGSGAGAGREQMEPVPAPVCLFPSCLALCLLWGWLPAARPGTGGFYLQGLAD